MLFVNELWFKNQNCLYFTSGFFFKGVCTRWVKRRFDMVLLPEFR